MFLQFAAAALTYVASLLGHPTHVLFTPLPTKITNFIRSSKKVPTQELVSGLTVISTPSPTPIPEIQGPPSATESASIVLTPSPLLAPTATPTPLPNVMVTPTPSVLPMPTAILSLTPTLVPIAAVTTPADLEALFSKYADQYHADKNLMEKIAKCESSFNSNATYMDYVGMFQFAPDSWTSQRNSIGLDPNPDLRKNSEEAIKTAAYMIGNSGASAWPSCAK